MSSSEEELDRNLSEDEDASEDEIPEEEDVSEEEEMPVKKRKAADSKPKPKKRRKPVNKFIEEEADVDEDEEEEEDDDDDFYRSERQMAEEVEAGHSYRYEPQDRTEFDESESAEAIVNRIKKRHQQSRKQYDGDEEGGEVIQSEVAQQSLLPSIQDPRMWVFKCKPGREQHLVVALMNKFIEFARRGEPLMVKSVVASNSKGFIYVEAEREPHAKDCLNGLRDVQQWSMKLVPIHEMTSVLNVQTRRKPLVAGAWARMKRAGLYKGDLCKVIEILDNGARAVVKMIPRLDPIVLAGGEQPKYKKGQRPPQKLFHANMVPGADVARRRYPSTGEMMDTFDNDFYQEGFLIKEVNIATMLTTEDVNPTLDEINRFSSVAGEDGEHAAEEMLASVEADDWKNKVDLTKGDTVRVIEGDLINLMGVVLSTNTANDTVRVMPLHEEIKDTILDFQLKQLMKYVKVGDHIKVVSGMYSGETGTVVAVDDSEGAPVAIVLVDSMAREIQVRVRDLQESAEISHGLDSYKGKELYDLVALAHGDVGVITHVGREGFTVLCQNGQSRNISDQEVQRKIVSSRTTAALDKKHNHVSVGEMVNVVEGPFAGHSGTVKHIYRTYLFIHNNRITTNSGMFVTRARGVILSGSKARSDMISNSTVPRMDAGMRQQNQRGGRNQRESELIGQTVKVKKGRWKGYIGIVVDESDQKVKVEIHCKAKIVDVDRLHITIAGTRDGGVVDKPRYAGTPMTGATPLPSQTPLHGSAMTPMATPLHRGMGTPQSSRNLSYREKLAIIEKKESEPSWTQCNLALWAKETFRLESKPTQATISNLLRDKHKLLNAAVPLEYRSARRVKHPELDQEMLKWVHQELQSGQNVTRTAIQNKAVELAQELQLPSDVSFSRGWVTSFMNRHQLNVSKKNGVVAAQDLNRMEEQTHVVEVQENQVQFQEEEDEADNSLEEPAEEIQSSREQFASVETEREDQSRKRKRVEDVWQSREEGRATGELLLDWIAVPGSYSRWWLLKTDEEKEPLCDEINLFLRSHGLRGMNSVDIRQQMTTFVTTFQAAHTWLRQSKVEYPVDVTDMTLEQEGIKSHVLHMCPHYERLVSVLAAYVNYDSSTSSEAQAATIETTPPPNGSSTLIQAPDTPIVVESPPKAKEPERESTEATATDSAEDETKAQKRRLFELECARLQSEIETRNVQLVLEKTLARKKLQDAGISPEEVDRIFPL